ncbi:MAG TPA: hypothetical protein VGQ87_00770 [Patescibacteria group bacterium]|jgi:hypothetical protein|nr:hypothetical protein [Patescibacteria group bacterium]
MHVILNETHKVLGDFQLARLACDLRKDPQTRDQASDVEAVLARRQQERTQAEQTRANQNR